MGAAMDPSAARRLRQVEEHLRCENAHDLDGLMSTFGASGFYDDAPWSEHHEGLEGVRTYYQTLLRAAPDFHIEVKHRHIAEDSIVLEVELTGTHLGAWRGLPATGRRVDFPLCAVYTFDGQDRLAGERIYYDRTTVLRLHYLTLATPGSPSVLVLHGTTGSGAQFLGPSFAGELFGPGQLLDPAKYFIVLPDGIGHGGSSKPSDGLHARFPHYGYADMVEAQRRLLLEKLGVKHLRLIVGTSMGCMHSWVWAEAQPKFMDANLAPACLPGQIAG